jgi:hypothetical protein
MPEGANAKTAFLQVHAPPNVECSSTSCVYFRIYLPDGRPTYEGSVKKGESFANVVLSELTNKPIFDIGDRGFYAVSVTIHSVGTNGVDIKTHLFGYLFIHVVKRDYISLLENEEDENFRWTWKSPTNQTIKLTTGGRVFVSAPQAHQGL